MNNKKYELSIIGIEKLIEQQTERIDRGAFWFFSGIYILVLGMIATPMLELFGIGSSLFGLEELMRGIYLKSHYKKRLPKNLPPLEISCIKCGNNLELDLEERLSGKYFCPLCNESLPCKINID